jgi:outer membrane protein assembly factor BamB
VTNSAVYVEQEAYFLQGSQRSDTYDSAIVRALRLRDGGESWQREVANTDKDSMLTRDRVSMQVDDQAVYLLRVGQVQETHGVVTGLFPRTTLFALNARDGSDRWRNPTQQDDAGRDFDLFLSDQTLYIRGVASPGLSSLSAFRSQTGASQWSWQTPFVLNPFAPPDHIYGSSLNKGESFCALKRSDGNKAWCADYNQAARVLFGQGRVYLVAFKIIYHDATISEEPAQLYILNESDGSLIAQYMPGGETTTALADLALS